MENEVFLQKLEIAIRELVKSIYCTCSGAYGERGYEGQFETEIQDLMKIIKGK